MSDINAAIGRAQLKNLIFLNAEESCANSMISNLSK